MVFKTWGGYDLGGLWPGGYVRTPYRTAVNDRSIRSHNRFVARWKSVDFRDRTTPATMTDSHELLSNSCRPVINCKRYGPTANYRAILSMLGGPWQLQKLSTRHHHHHQLYIYRAPITYSYNLQHCLEWNMRGICHSIQCCNLLISWPTYVLGLWVGRTVTMYRCWAWASRIISRSLSTSSVWSLRARRRFTRTGRRRSAAHLPRHRRRSSDVRRQRVAPDRKRIHSICADCAGSRAAPRVLPARPADVRRAV